MPLSNGRRCNESPLDRAGTFREDSVMLADAKNVNREPRCGSLLSDSRNVAVVIRFDPEGRGDFGKRRHPDDGTGQGDEESGAIRDLEIPHGNCEIPGTPAFGRIVGKRVLRLGDTDGKAREATAFEQSQFPLRLSRELHARGPVDSSDNGVQRIPHAAGRFIQHRKRRRWHSCRSGNEIRQFGTPLPRPDQRRPRRHTTRRGRHTML